MDQFVFDFSNLKETWEELEKRYREKYINNKPDHSVSYNELCEYIDHLLNSGLGKKKSLEFIKKRFS